MLLLYGSGLRISEALSLKERSSNSDWLRVLGKGNKRDVPLLPIICDGVNSYLEACPFKTKDDDPLFLGKRGGPLSLELFKEELKA